MSESLKDLRLMSESKLIEKHDRLALNTAIGINHYLSELMRRDQEKHSKDMKKFTFWITIMTFIITIFTALNVILFIIKK